MGFDLFRREEERKCLNAGHRQLFGFSVSEDARKGGDFGNPAPVQFALDLNFEGHLGLERTSL